MVDSLYIHIPFCNKICAYCDFTKLIKNEEFENKYIQELLKEIDSYKIKKVKTIYIGGGTPTALNDKNFEIILKKASGFKKADYEFTVEANVESLSLTKLNLMKKYGVNRLSIGIQSSNDSILKAINREHTFKDAKELIMVAKCLGFDNINVDLIYGLKNQDIEKELENFIALNANHISIYALSVSPGSIFFNEHYETLDNEKDATTYELIHKYMVKRGYIHYEISNFARKSYESRHNLTYWKDKEYYGVGLGASGYLNGIRYTNVTSLKEYLEGNYRKEEEKLSIKEEEFEYLMLAFRLKQGFLKEEYKKRFNADFTTKYHANIEKYHLDNYLVETKTRIKPTFKMMMLLDNILLKLTENIL